MLHLCATSRLAQTLRAKPPAGGATVWPTCQALTVGAWLDGLVEEAVLLGLAAPAITLDAHSEQLLWEHIIADALESGAALLFDVRGMAATAVEAHALCETWGLRPNAPDLSTETRLFIDWQRDFRRRCEARGWRTGVQQAGLAIDLVAAGQLPLPTSVHFAGFDRFTPPEQRLRQALQAQGVEIMDVLPDERPPGAARALACPDLAAECRAVAAWAKERLARQPGARLGIVAPDLRAVREPLEFALDDALHPELLRPAGFDAPRAFNFSLGRPLAALPLVRTGLELIALATLRQVEQPQLSALLLDPFWSAGEAEAGERARLDATMRRELEFQTSLAALLRLAKRHIVAEEARWRICCPLLVRDLEAFAKAAAGAGRKRLPSAWGGIFRSWLKALAWPGDRRLSSHEYQAREAFLECLDGLARLDDILGPVSGAEAARRLAHAAAESVFQPKTSGQPPIQVLGGLESAGLEFDALWVLGMNDHVWPAAPRPNPLLPAEAQRRARSPHACAEVELDFAAAVHARLLRAAPEITFSFSRMDGNRLLRVSPLIAGLAAAPWQEAAAPLPDTPALERLADVTAPVVGDGEKVRGGTGLLKAQAVCPAWGFYQFRLGAEALGQAVDGLAPSERGSLVHLALEAFWTETKSLAALKALSETALAARIAAASAAAMAKFEEETHKELPARYRELEAARLDRLLAVWLGKEMERVQDFTVVGCEQAAELEIEGIRVRTVADRIDQLADGRRLIIDYKTGRNIDTRNWSEDRITEPQLPVYAALAAADAGPVAAAVFARVRLDEPAFAGVAESDGILPGVVGLDGDKRKGFDALRFPDWEAVLRHWHERLHAVAAEVKAGVAGVCFADADALKYCEVAPLLRLAERRQQLEAADGDGAHD